MHGASGEELVALRLAQFQQWLAIANSSAIDQSVDLLNMEGVLNGFFRMKKLLKRPDIGTHAKEDCSINQIDLFSIASKNTAC